MRQHIVTDHLADEEHNAGIEEDLHKAHWRRLKLTKTQTRKEFLEYMHGIGLKKIIYIQLYFIWHILGGNVELLSRMSCNVMWYNYVHWIVIMYKD